MGIANRTFLEGIMGRFRIQLGGVSWTTGDVIKSLESTLAQAAKLSEGWVHRLLGYRRTESGRFVGSAALGSRRDGRNWNSAIGR